MREVEATGKTIEKAIENGLKELNTTMENVDIKILNEGGLLKKAKVLITLSEDNEEQHEEKNTNSSKPKAPVKEQAEETENVEYEHVCENGVCELRPKKKETKAETIKSKPNEEKKVEEQESTKEQVNLEEVANTAKEFVNGLIYMLNMEAEVKAEVVDKFPTVKVSGNDLGVLIGYRGDALEAIQNLMNVVVFNNLGYKGKVILDIENYRERRVQTLCDLADRIAKQVLRSKKSFKLEPMNSYERRVIHTHLQNREHISTHSEGKEPDRHLIIDYVE